MSDEHSAPKIDPRTADDITAQTEAMVTSLLEGAWRPAEGDDGDDPLGALIKIFGALTSHAVDRINAVPNAAFDSYLKLIGIRPQPPAPARVPLTFSLVKDSPEDAVVPAGTQVGATADPDDANTDEIVFETEDELIVSRASLIGAFSYDPARDHLDDVTDAGTGWIEGEFSPFSPRTPAAHDLFIACPEALNLEGISEIKVALRLRNKGTTNLETLPLRWSAWDGLEWRELAVERALALVNGVHVLTTTIASPPTLQYSKIGDLEARWLRARLDTTAIPSGWDHPDGRRMVDLCPELLFAQLSAKCAGEGIAPRFIVREATKLDATRELHPFGEEPRETTTLYVDGATACAHPPGTLVKLSVTLADAVSTPARAPTPSDDLLLIWELAAGPGEWIELGRSSGASSFIASQGNQNPHSFTDDTFAFKAAGTVSFRLPHVVPELKVAGQRGRFLRVRIARGGYGKPVHVAFNDQTNQHQLVASTLRPPMIKPPRLSFEHAVTDVEATAHYAQNLGHLELLPRSITPFTSSPRGMPALGDRPALYLCFDQPFARRPVNLFLQVIAPEPEETQPPDSIPLAPDPPRIAWHRLGAQGFRGLGVRDATNALRERGTVRFVGPADLSRSPAFGREGYWLRVSWSSGSFRTPPRLARVLSNTIWAAHAVTRRLEILGSGSGGPNLTLKTAASPVLAGARIEVREVDKLDEDEATALRLAHGDDVTIEYATDGAPKAAWIRWQPVANFYASGPDDRHFKLDPDSGEVRFGDGRAGRVPPRGDANIRAAAYRTGGGTRGNRPKAMVSELKTTIPFVAEVVNHEPASGGTSREDDARLRARGPLRLRHRERAVTARDFIDMALEAAPEVIRAHAITCSFNPIDMVVDLAALESAAEDAPVGTDARGWVTVAEVPEDTAEVGARANEVRVVIVEDRDVDRPAPSLGLIDRVEAYLSERSAPATRLWVSGPRWIKVTVSARVVPTPGAAADDLTETVTTALTRYLHPLTGGEQGVGWPFGRAPRRSHLFRLLESIDGLDHVDELAVTTEPPLPDDTAPLTEEQRRALEGALIYSGEHDIVLSPFVEDEEEEEV